MTTVRKMKSGDQLAVGDWLAPGALMERAAEVLFACSYPANADAVASGLAASNHGGTQVQLVVREQGRTGVWPDLVSGSTLFDLASDEDLAEYRAVAERAAKIADIRAFADWLEANPDVPMPYGIGGQADFTQNATAADLSAMDAFAKKYGAEVYRHLNEHTSARIKIGSVGYALIAWHKDGRPGEPDAEATKSRASMGWDGPCVASLHILTPGESCLVCGAEGVRLDGHVGVSAEWGETAGAQCACTFEVSGFDTLDEAEAALAQHIQDATAAADPVSESR
jgi:hypothetical protein